MKTKISRVGLSVDDQAQAKEFWTNKMGYRVVTDLPYDAEDEAGPRWLEFQPPGQDLVLVVTQRGEGDPSTQGQLAHIILECEDLDATHEQLLSRGVEFANPPTDQMWGRSATFKDPEGTLFVINEAR